jgi:protocatechuate 3,4-dioxygenase beta subunit
VTRLTSYLTAAIVLSLLPWGTSESQAAKRHAHPSHAAKSKSRGEIRVTVLDGSGNAVSGATVHLHKAAHHAKSHAHKAKRHHASVAPHATAGKKHKHHHSGHRSGRTAVTDSAGMATFSNCHPGRYHVRADKTGVGRGRAHAASKGGSTKAVKVRLGQHAAHHGKSGKHRHASVAPHASPAAKQ